MRKDWIETTIGNVADYLNGRGFKKSDWETEGLPIIRIQNLNKLDAPFNYTQNSYEAKYSVKNGDLLFSWSASLGVYIWNRGDAWLNQHIFKVVPKDFILKDYLLYSLQSIIKLLYTKTHGSGMVHITKKNFEATKFHLPPLTEQRAIVTKIEELFSDLDKGIADLKKAQDQLKVYRQAVLKKAFEGELTKEWREQQTDLPTADELLEQIKEERQKHYEQQIESWKQAVQAWEENGKEGKKPKKPRALDTSVINDWNEKFATPTQWKLCQMGDIISDLTDYHANGSYVVLKENVELSDSPDYAVMIRATNFEKNDFINDLKYVNEHGYNFLSKSKLFGGEILIGKIGNAGRVYHMPYLNRKASLAMNLFALRIDLVLSSFIYYQLKNFYQEREIKSYVRGVGNPTIDKISIRSIHINLCSSKEQHQIVQEIEFRLSVCDKVEESINESLEKAMALRQSILKKAFEGTLLSEEEIAACKAAPDYEPASVLLEKIKAENATLTNKK